MATAMLVNGRKKTRTPPRNKDGTFRKRKASTRKRSSSTKRKTTTRKRSSGGGRRAGTTIVAVRNPSMKGVWKRVSGALPESGAIGAGLLAPPAAAALILRERNTGWASYAVNAAAVAALALVASKVQRGRYVEEVLAAGIVQLGAKVLTERWPDVAARVGLTASPALNVQPPQAMAGVARRPQQVAGVVERPRLAGVAQRPRTMAGIARRTA